MPYSLKHKRDTRDKILESARRLFNKRGFSEVSIDEVMENAGLTRGGFYRHFRDKDELYAEAVRRFLCADAPKPWQSKTSEGMARKPRSQRIVDAYFSRDHFEAARALDRGAERQRKLRQFKRYPELAA
jgi:TetR/AcrR family transcriptional regulator, transcriptional repressor for nem operon